MSRATSLSTPPFSRPIKNLQEKTKQINHSCEQSLYPTTHLCTLCYTGAFFPADILCCRGWSVRTPSCPSGRRGNVDPAVVTSSAGVTYNCCSSTRLHAVSPVSDWKQGFAAFAAHFHILTGRSDLICQVSPITLTMAWEFTPVSRHRRARKYKRNPQN